LPTEKTQVNVLQHIMGYFKKNLSHDEKQELLSVFEQYRSGYVPLIVPITLINHYVRKYDQPWLKTQTYLNPHPFELKLRNYY
ncbi:MAG: YbgA family protein, partial [Desulfobacula sp.]|nr:YbgA family protein [Desulfobacula sp.]